MSDNLIQLRDLESASQVIRRYVHRTPTFSASTIGDPLNIRLFFKAELLQKSGSFKARGALNRLIHLSEADRARGVITMSAGNHAAGLAFAAAQLGISAVVVMPENAARNKVEATRAYGGEVILHGSVTDLLPKCQQLQQERGLVFVHPFDDPFIIAGQGTVGLEILEDVPDVDVVLVPIGGGGLIAGVAAALKSQRPSVRVIGVEPEGANAMWRSVRASAPVHLDSVSTIADGLAAPFAGALNLAHVQRYVDDIVLVSDEEIIAALRLILARSKLLAEPSAAAPLAALLQSRVTLPGGARVVSILSGGNMDLDRLRSML